MRSRIRWIGVVAGAVLACSGARVAQAAREFDPADLFIMVEPMAAIEAQKQRLKSEGRLSDDNMPIYRPLAGDLVEVLAINHQDAVEIPQLWMFANIFKSGQDKTWAMALRNTSRLTQPVQVRTEQNGDLVVTTFGYLSPSVLLEDQIWSSPQFNGEGDVVLVVDQRGLLVGHARNPKQLQDLKKILALGANDPNLVAKTLMVRRNGRWEVYP